MTSVVQLGVGDEAWCLLERVDGTRSRSGDRRTLVGAARVRIEAIEGEAYRVVVLLARFWPRRELEGERSGDAEPAAVPQLHLELDGAR